MATECVKHKSCPQGTLRVQESPKTLGKCPKRGAGGAGRHICNNLLKEAIIIDTGKNNGGGGVHALLLAWFWFFVFFLFFWGRGEEEGKGETSQTRRTSSHRQRNTDVKATDIFTTTI